MAGLNECIICWSSLTSSDAFAITKCGHIFHQECIKKWLNNENSCPSCRIRAKEKDIIKLNMQKGIGHKIETNVNLESIKDCLKTTNIFPKNGLAFSLNDSMKFFMHQKAESEIQSKCRQLDKMIEKTESNFSRLNKMFAIIDSKNHELDILKAKAQSNSAHLDRIIAMNQSKSDHLHKMIAKFESKVNNKTVETKYYSLKNQKNDDDFLFGTAVGVWIGVLVGNLYMLKKMSK